MTLSTKRVLYGGVALLFCLGLCRAARFRFQDKEQAIRTSCSDQLKALGGNRNALKVKYFTPEIQMVTGGSLVPGATGEVVVKGKFAPDTKFIIENDNFEVVKESLVGNEYHATVKAAAGMGPQTATLMAMTPVTCLTARHDAAVSVCGKFEWTLDAANGWRVVARSPAGKTCGGNNNQQDTYDLTFFRKGETKPFESRQGTLNFSVYDATNYTLNVGQPSPPAGQPSPEDMQAMVQKMMDPKLTSAQRDELMKKLEQIQKQMSAQMESAVKQMQDPNYAQKQAQAEQQFGCQQIYLAVQGGNLTGRMRCSDKVGREIALNGSSKLLGK